MTLPVAACVCCLLRRVVDCYPEAGEWTCLSSSLHHVLRLKRMQLSSVTLLFLILCSPLFVLYANARSGTPRGVGRRRSNPSSSCLSSFCATFNSACTLSCAEYHHPSADFNKRTALLYKCDERGGFYFGGSFGRRKWFDVP